MSRIEGHCLQADSAGVNLQERDIKLKRKKNENMTEKIEGHCLQVDSAGVNPQGRDIKKKKA